LRDEKLHIVFDPKPKQPALFSLRTPIMLSGTFAKPSVETGGMKTLLEKWPQLPASPSSIHSRRSFPSRTSVSRGIMPAKKFCMRVDSRKRELRMDTNWFLSDFWTFCWYKSVVGFNKLKLLEKQRLSYHGWKLLKSVLNIETIPGDSSRQMLVGLRKAIFYHLPWRL
jgi:hypothetical protein